MESEQKNRLLSDFPPHTYGEWREAAIQLLKGRPFEKTLITPTYEGIELEPIYTRETLPELAHLGDQPGTGSQVRGSRLEGYLEAGWLVSQELTGSTAEDLNVIALKELEAGQDELNIWLDRPTREGRDASREVSSVGVCGISLSTVGDMKRLLQGIHPEMISLYWQSGTCAPALYALLVGVLQEKGVSGEAVRGCLGLDPVGWLADTGSFPGERERVFDIMAGLMESARETLPALQVIEARGHAYHDAGSSSVQEMAAVLSTAVTYLKELQQRGVDPADSVPRLRLSLSVGGNYFIEVAKLRAMRLLWSRVMDGFGVPESARRVHLHARTGQFNKTLFDPYVNMLRTTTEAFSAVVGGCDSLHVAPFDEIIRESDAFSRRLARNTHPILAEECGMTRVLDPAGGSWAVETLTDEMAREAWKRFQEMEAGGGILGALESGSLQESIEAVRSEKMKNIQRRKDVIVGTNSYPNATERLLERPGLDYDAVLVERIGSLEVWKSAREEPEIREALGAVKKASGADRIGRLVDAAAAGATLGEMMEALELGEPGIAAKPVRLKRAAEEFEALRLAARALETAGRRPRVHQLNMGPSRRYRIRADWTSSFFQVGGFEVLNEEDYDDTAAALEALKASGVKTAVITSDDEAYAEVVEPLTRAIKETDPAITVIVAGAPGDNEESWRAAGVDDFVHVRVNNYTFNRALLESLGARL